MDYGQIDNIVTIYTKFVLTIVIRNKTDRLILRCPHGHTYCFT
jgi:hypothetical protein